MSATEGLRERKKRRTRQEISDVATRLFFEHGFEQVTLAQIAAAAEVSVKTIFNHFGSKEDLYFDRAQELDEGLRRTITERPPGTTILESLHALLRDNRVPLPGQGWGGLEEEQRYGLFRAFLATQDRSPALRARRLIIGEEMGRGVAAVIGSELGRDPDDPAVQALAAALVAVMNLRDRALRTAMAEGVRPPALRDRVVAVVDEAFARLAKAFGDIDRAR